LNKREFFLKLMIDGVVSKPFSARTIEMPALPENARETKEKVIRVSRERYGKQRAVVEDKIARWLDAINEPDGVGQSSSREKAKATNTKPSIQQNARGPASSQPSATSQSSAVRHLLVCDSCGTQVQVSFDPDPSKNIYCRECLKKYRNGELPEHLPSKNRAFFASLSAFESSKKIDFLHPPADISIQSIDDRDDDSDGYVKLADLAKLKGQIEELKDS